MSCMFSDCISLEEIFFSNFNTENVKSMYSMLRKYDSLKEINLFKFNSENVNDMSCLNNFFKFIFGYEFRFSIRNCKYRT